MPVIPLCRPVRGPVARRACLASAADPSRAASEHDGASLGRGAGRAIAGLALAALLPLTSMARPPADTPELPVEVAAALQRARVPASALSVVVQEAGSGRTLLSVNATQPVNPASLAKLVTTYAALDRLGPAWRWRTPVWLTGPVKDGVLSGDLVLRGSGDPTLVIERLWLLLRRVQQAGVREIAGDIVLDTSAFAVPPGDPGEFDGEPLRPYNVRPDALMLNFKSIVYTFVPEPATGQARVSATPTLAGARVDASVPLGDAPCGDWRAALQASFGDDGRVRFAGRYPAACGERAWPVADPVPATYNARLVEGQWREMGGTLRGRVRDGLAPSATAPSLVAESPTLSEVVRDINKFSNNTMARQLLLTLAAEAAPGVPATPTAARALLMQWLHARVGPDAADAWIDNGSGLSREGRLSAQLLARLLQQAWSSPVMPDLMASLPAAALDGTLRRARIPAGRAHLKTGSLRDVVGVAGYVLGDAGKRYVVVAIVNHPDAAAARPAIDTLVRWAAADGSER